MHWRLPNSARNLAAAEFGRIWEKWPNFGLAEAEAEIQCNPTHDQYHTNVNEHLLLAPSDGCNITKKDDRQIKDALFEYLTTVERSL